MSLCSVRVADADRLPQVFPSSGDRDNNPFVQLSQSAMTAIRPAIRDGGSQTTSNSLCAT